MTEEKALKLFAKGYHRGDFSDVFAHMHKKVSYEAFYRFYRHDGRESVQRVLNEKAAELRAMPLPNRAYNGFMMVKHDIIGTRCESCLVLTGDDPRNVLGIVRIKCTPLKIRDIRILDPAQCKYTRGDLFPREAR